MTSSRTLLLLAALLGAGAALSQARAAPLDAEACTKLMIEQGSLEKAGVEQDMAKGVEWAKANLGVEKLNQPYASYDEYRSGGKKTAADITYKGTVR